MIPVTDIIKKQSFKMSLRIKNSNDILIFEDVRLNYLPDQ